MRAVIQRVSEASVCVAGEEVARIGAGLLVLVCAMQGDSEENARLLAEKIRRLRIFADDRGRMNRSLADTGGAALVVSQFTLAADTSRGNRPGFSTAAPPDRGRALYEAFAAHLQSLGTDAQTGIFGADMAVRLTNDGPVTIWIER